MDSNSTYLLTIKMLANCKKSRKDVGFPPSYSEVAHIKYFDEGMKNFLEVKLDQELMAMFSKHLKSKVVDMFVQYIDPSETYEPKRVHHIGSEPIVQGETQISAHGGYMHLQRMMTIKLLHG
ncbi:hypothetical protein BS78_04G142900 [Paspalum vaginatum]|nr:hypothetical protein BS78_04G142900 [Paspalum vaginatum]